MADALGVGLRLHAPAHDLIAAQIEDLFGEHLFEGGDVFQRLRRNARVHVRNVGARAVKGEQPAVEKALVADALAVQVGSEELFGGGHLVHEAAEGLGVIQPPFRLFFDLAQDGAAQPLARVFDDGKQLQLPAAVRRARLRHAAAFFPQKHAEDAVVNFAELLFHVGVKFFRIDIFEVRLRDGDGVVYRRGDVDALVLQQLQKVFVYLFGLDLFQLQHLRELVDEGVEGVAGGQNEHVGGL